MSSAKRKAGWVAGALLLSLVVASAAEAAPGTVFSYSDPGVGLGYFQRSGDGSWVEVNAHGTVFHFAETRDTGFAVRMYDPSRAVGIMITGRTAYIRFPGSSGWQFIYSGQWVQ